jgi:hypothetical protein
MEKVAVKTANKLFLTEKVVKKSLSMSYIQILHDSLPKRLNAVVKLSSPNLR